MQLQSTSVFFSRSHLLQRKMKRHIRFSIEQILLSRNDEQNSHKLPSDFINTNSVNNTMSRDLRLNALTLELDPERASLFDIDSYTGKVIHYQSVKFNRF
jgi:hypothetical protein